MHSSQTVVTRMQSHAVLLHSLIFSLQPGITIADPPHLSVSCPPCCRLCSTRAAFQQDISSAVKLPDSFTQQLFHNSCPQTASSSSTQYAIDGHGGSSCGATWHSCATLQSGKEMWHDFETQLDQNCGSCHRSPLNSVNQQPAWAHPKARKPIGSCQAYVSLPQRRGSEHERPVINSYSEMQATFVARPPMGSLAGRANISTACSTQLSENRGLPRRCASKERGRAAAMCAMQYRVSVLPIVVYSAFHDLAALLVCKCWW